jgi:hypothetical protein
MEQCPVASLSYVAKLDNKSARKRTRRLPTLTEVNQGPSAAKPAGLSVSAPYPPASSIFSESALTFTSRRCAPIQLSDGA